MSMELQIIRSSDFIRVGPEKTLDFAASKAALAELAAACRKRGINRAMLDLRGLEPGPTPVFSPTDLANLVNTFHEIGFTNNEKLAVLYGSDPHHRARMFAFIGTLRGWHVAAFGSYEDAMLWLSDDSKAAPEVESQSEEAVPLKIVVPKEPPSEPTRAKS